MTSTTTHTGTAGERSATMAAQILTVDISDTVGQESAIQANGGPVFTIKVTYPARELAPTKAGVRQHDAGFGKVVSDGPVKGYKILYTVDSVVG